MNDDLQARDLNPEVLATELDVLSRSVTAAATKLARLTKEYEGTADENGEFQLGPGALYAMYLDAEIEAIVEESSKAERRPPAEDVRAAMARSRVRTKYPDLVNTYTRLTTEMKAHQMWLHSQKASMNSRQSVLNAARDMSGSRT